MYCRVIACDFDGTGASDGHLAPELAAALARAREQGILTLLVTGRLLEDVQNLCPDGGVFDGIVAENGALIALCGRDRTITAGTPPPAEFLTALRQKRVPFHAGEVIVGTWESHLTDVIQLIRKHALDAQIIFNRGALMVLPSGVNKATGVHRVLDEVGRSHHNLVAFGDAENDLPMLELAAMGVAARNSIASVEAAADASIRHEGGAGVARLIHRIVDASCVITTPSRQRITIGFDDAGDPATIPTSGSNIMVSGDPRSGKSWLAGWVGEQLLDRGLQLCIFDPEGDYGTLGERPRVVVFGVGGVALPAPTALPRLLRDAGVSVVLDLANQPFPEQVAYIDAALSEIGTSRDRTGLPHWIIVDEAHNFFHEGAVSNVHLSSMSGNFLLVTYRPSLIAADVFDKLGTYLMTTTASDEERYFLTRLMQAKGPGDVAPADALAALHTPVAGMLRYAPDERSWRLFTPGQRITTHAHHAHKYIDVQLSDERAFRFLHTGQEPGAIAHNIAEFHHAITVAPRSSLRHHLSNGDFSRWVLDVLGDRMLASSLRKLERTAAVGATINRAELVACIEDAYAIRSSSSS